MKHPTTLLLIALVAIGAGCSKEKMDELVSSATETATNVASDVTETASNVTSDVTAAATDAATQATTAVQTAAETAGDVTGVADFTGKANMNLDTSTDFGASYVRLLTVEGRPGVLQIKSNKDGEHGEYPSFLIQAQVDATDLNSLADKTVSARLFAQKEAEGPIWFSKEGEDIPLTIKVTDGKVSASIENAMVLDSSTLKAAPLSGTFECAMLQ